MSASDATGMLRHLDSHLALALGTVKWHLHNLFSRLGVRSRTQVVLKGKSLGLLSEA